MRVGASSARARIRRPVRSSPVARRLLGPDRLDRAQQREAAARDDALGDRGLGRADRVLERLLAALGLGLGRGADADHGDAAGQLGERAPAASPCRSRSWRPRISRRRRSIAVGDRALVAGAADDRRACPCRRRRATAVPRSSSLTFSSFWPSSGEITWPPVRVAMSSSMLLAAVAEPGRLDGHGAQRAAHAVDDQRRERLGLDVLGDDQERAAALRDVLEQRDERLHRRRSWRRRSGSAASRARTPCARRR